MLGYMLERNKKYYAKVEDYSLDENDFVGGLIGGRAVLKITGIGNNNTFRRIILLPQHIKTGSTYDKNGQPVLYEGEAIELYLDIDPTYGLIGTDIRHIGRYGDMLTGFRFEEQENYFRRKDTLEGTNFFNRSYHGHHSQYFPGPNKKLHLRSRPRQVVEG